MLSVIFIIRFTKFKWRTINLSNLNKSTGHGSRPSYRDLANIHRRTNQRRKNKLSRSLRKTMYFNEINYIPIKLCWTEFFINFRGYLRLVCGKITCLAEWVIQPTLLLILIKELIPLTCLKRSFQKILGTANTPMKRYDLMHEINGRGTFMVSQICLPYLLQSKTKHGRVPHILNNAPVRKIILFNLILFNLILS